MEGSERNHIFLFIEYEVVEVIGVVVVVIGGSNSSSGCSSGCR